MTDTEPLSETLVEAPPLHDQVYERLREAILVGELRPGERISAALIAARFSISAMPVRDALRRLEQEGLVETAARRWTRVATIHPSLVQEVVPLVALLEQYAITSTEQIDPAILDDMERANADYARAAADGDMAGCTRADGVFHDLVIRLANNRSLERAVRDAKTAIRLLRSQVLDPDLARKSTADHAGIVDALRAGDRERAVAHLADNWARGVARYEQVQVGEP